MLTVVDVAYRLCEGEIVLDWYVDSGLPCKRRAAVLPVVLRVVARRQAEAALRNNEVDDNDLRAIVDAADIQGGVCDAMRCCAMLCNALQDRGGKSDALSVAFSRDPRPQGHGTARARGRMVRAIAHARFNYAGTPMY